MPFIKFRYIFLFLLLISKFTFAQQQQDIELVRLADEMYSFGSKRDALDIYLKACSNNAKNAKAFYMAGRCYLDLFQKTQALEYLQKASKLNSKIDNELFLYLARALQATYKFDEAIVYYKKYKTVLANDKDDKEANATKIKLVDKKINECTIATFLLKDTVKLDFNKTNENLNSLTSDYAPVISNDEKTIYFTSRRQGSTGNKKDNDNEFYEDIYFSKLENGSWSKPQNIGPPINTDYHEGCIGISKDGKTLYIYREVNGGDIYSSHLSDDGKWGKPVPLNQNINTDGYEPSMTLADAGNSIIFSSNKPGGLGGLDLYISKKDEKGDWGEPINLGPQVNTEFDEDGPFFDEKSKYLYFSSAGHQGMGGYDVFRSKRDSLTQKWMEPLNLGFPINTPDDDIFYTLNAKGDKAFYSTYKKDGSGDRDIFEMDFPVDEFKKTDSIRKAKGIKITDIKRLQEIKEIERKKQIEEDKKKQDSIAKLAADEKAKLDSLKAIEAKKAALAKKRDELNKVNKTTDQEKKNKELAQQHQQENKGHIPEEKDLTIQEKLELQRIADEQKKHDLAKKAKTEEKKKSYLDKDQFKKDSMVTIKGKIVDSKTGKALQAHIEIYDGKGNVFFKTQAASDGAYSFKMPARMLTEYSMSVEIDGYMYKADKIKYDKTDDKNSLQTDVKLNKLETGLKTVLRNVYFELNSAKLNPESYAELNKLAALLVSNKNIKARIGGHTDNLGPESFNKALSMRRVYVVMDYLMKHGIDRDRLEGIGYGSSRPIASNDDEFEGRELNRRTEFEIIK